MAKINNARRYPGVGGSRRNPVGLKVSKEAAMIREEEWRKLTPQQQIAALDQRLGKNVGATKQRARINALIK